MVEPFHFDSSQVFFFLQKNKNGTSASLTCPCGSCSSVVTPSQCLTAIAALSALLPLLFLNPLIIYHPKCPMAMSSTIGWCCIGKHTFLPDYFIGFPLIFSCYEKVNCFLFIFPFGSWVELLSCFTSSSSHCSCTLLFTHNTFIAIYCFSDFITNSWGVEKGNSRGECNARGFL